ncbi:hypothetical protein LAV79_24060 [Peribacillus butanolivorans]
MLNQTAEAAKNLLQLQARKYKKEEHFQEFFGGCSKDISNQMKNPWRTTNG